MIEHHSLYQSMMTAAAQTFENMAFMEIMEHQNPDYTPAAEDLAWTSMLIHDPIQGELRLAMPLSFLKKTTAGIFALAEDEVKPSQMTDILNELLNTIGGLFMTRLLTEDQEYQLGLPEPGDGQLPDIDSDTIVWKLMTSDEDPIQIFACGASLVALKNNSDQD